MWFEIKIIVCFLLGNIQSEPLPSDVVKSIEHNILSYRLVKEGYLGVNEFDHFDVDDPEFSRYFLKSGSNLLLTISKCMDPIYPDPDFETFLIENPRKSIIAGDSLIQMVSTMDGYEEYLDHFLIAYNSTSKEIKYLGGRFYKSQISMAFGSDNESIIEMLKLKYFNYKLINMKCSRRKKKYQFFKGYSENINRSVVFKVDRMYRDNIEVVFE